MKKIRRELSVLNFALLAGTFLPFVAHAQGTTTLTFELATGYFGDNTPLPANYGNRVIANMQDGFRYIVTNGGTPNVIMQYSAGSLPQLTTWSSNFGDLKGVAITEEPNVFRMRLIADPGYYIMLNSFDMSAWPHLDYTIKAVRVLDGNGNALYSQSNVLIQGAASGPQHTHFTFSNVNANILQIEFDSTNVDSDDVGIDNISFTQTSTNPQSAASGTVTLLDCTDPEQNITFEFRPKPSGTPFKVKQVLAQSGPNSGTFSLPNIPQGTYDIAVKGYSWLQQVIPNVVVTGNVSGLAATLWNGDLNGDNSVDIADFGILVNNYSSVGDP